MKKRARIECYTKHEMLQKGEWCAIPLAVQRSKLLSDGAKMLLLEYYSWVIHHDGVCRPSQTVVAWHLNKTVRQVQRLQKELAHNRVIVVVRRKNEENANRPNKIKFAKDLSHLAPRDRLVNNAAVYGDTMRREMGLPPRNIEKDPKRRSS